MRMLRAIDLRDVTELVNWLVNIAQGFGSTLRTYCSVEVVIYASNKVFEPPR